MVNLNGLNFFYYVLKSNISVKISPHLPKVKKKLFLEIIQLRPRRQTMSEGQLSPQFVNINQVLWEQLAFWLMRSPFQV